MYMYTYTFFFELTLSLLVDAENSPNGQVLDPSRKPYLETSSASPSHSHTSVVFAISVGAAA